jgi:HK97 family phage prohead protease
VKERRIAATDIEFREADDGYTFAGYAAVFNSETNLGPFREQVAPTAFNKTIRDGADVRFLVNHDGLPFARTKSGTLSLDTDERGLRVEARLDPKNPEVQALASAMRRGDLDQMSFGFQTVQDEWDDSAEPSLRTLKEVRLFDVSVVTYPAYEDTTAELRSQAEQVWDQRSTEPHDEPAGDTSTEAAPDHSDALRRIRINQNRRRRRVAA